MRPRASAWLVGCMLAAARVASADEAAAPVRELDPAAIEAADANLEPIAARQGTVITVAVGGGFSVGLGVDDATGTGGGAVLRLGHVASRRAIALVELAATAVLSAGTYDGQPIKDYRRDSLALLVGGQYYVGPVLWLRLAAGVGRYVAQPVETTSEPSLIVKPRLAIAGVAGSVGAGLDLIRLKRVRAGFELMSTVYLTRDGALAGNALLLSLTVD